MYVLYEHEITSNVLYEELMKKYFYSHDDFLSLFDELIASIPWFNTYVLAS